MDDNHDRDGAGARLAGHVGGRLRTLLELAAIALVYCRKGRIVCWARALVGGSDAGLKGAAYDGLHAGIATLESASALRTLAAAIETGEDGRGVRGPRADWGVRTNEVLCSGQTRH
jgi:hypothetical protein